MRCLLACLLIWLGGAALAATGCLRPVEGSSFDAQAGGLPALCIATAHYSLIPGYSKLLVHRDSCGLHTIERNRLVALDGEYPHAALWAYRDYDVAADGTVYGYGAKHPRRIFRMRSGEGRFTALPINGYLRAAYDGRSDRLLIRFDGKHLHEWSAAHGMRTSSLAGLKYRRDDVLPQYFEAVGGYLASSEERLFWHAESGGDWQRIRLGWFDRHRPDDLWMLKPRRSYLDAESDLFALQFSSDVLVFDVSGGGVPEFLYSVRDVDRVFHVEDGPIVAVIGGLLLDDKRAHHTVRVIGRDGSRLVRPDDAVEGEQAEKLAVPWNGVSSTGYVLPPLFHVDDTWMFFDGARFVAAPALGREKGTPVRWTQWGERLFLLDERGWWEVRRDLTLAPGELPLSYRSPVIAEMEVSDTFGAILAARPEKGLWVSRDGLSFAQIDAGDVPVRRYVTDLPGGEEGVVLADDGLYLIDEACLDAAFR